MPNYGISDTDPFRKKPKDVVAIINDGVYAKVMLNDDEHFVGFSLHHPEDGTQIGTWECRHTVRGDTISVSDIDNHNSSQKGCLDLTMWYLTKNTDSAWLQITNIANNEIEDKFLRNREEYGLEFEPGFIRCPTEKVYAVSERKLTDHEWTLRSQLISLPSPPISDCLVPLHLPDIASTRSVWINPFTRAGDGTKNNWKKSGDGGLQAAIDNQFPGQQTHVMALTGKMKDNFLVTPFFKNKTHVFVAVTDPRKRFTDLPSRYVIGLSLPDFSSGRLGGVTRDNLIEQIGREVNLNVKALRTKKRTR